MSYVAPNENIAMNVGDTAPISISGSFISNPGTISVTNRTPGVIGGGVANGGTATVSGNIYSWSGSITGQGAGTTVVDLFLAGALWQSIGVTVQTPQPSNFPTLTIGQITGP